MSNFAEHAFCFDVGFCRKFLSLKSFIFLAFYPILCYILLAGSVYLATFEPEKGAFMEQDKLNNSIYDSPDFLPFTNDNIFMNVMRSPKICRGILELVLPNEEFGEIRIMKCKPVRIWY